jgi:hypothetical protein
MRRISWKFLNREILNSLTDDNSHNVEKIAPQIRYLLSIFIFSLSFSWLFVTPLGNVADEPWYTVYANAVASGQPYGQVRIPKYLAENNKLACPAFHPNITADCQAESKWDAKNQKLVKVAPADLIRGYPEPYFEFVGQPSRILAGVHSLYGMRIFSLALCLFSLVILIWAWPRRYLLSLTLALVLVMTPMVTSFMSAVNPNGFEMVSGLVLSGLLTALILTDLGDRKKILFIKVAVIIEAGFLSVAKPWSFIYAILIITTFATGILASKIKIRTDASRQQDFRFHETILPIKLSELILLSALSGVIGFLSNSSYRKAMDLLGTKEAVLSLKNSARIIVPNITSYAMEFIGFLGWRDYYPPMSVRVIWAALLAVLVLIAVSALNVYQRSVAISYILALLLVLPIASTKALGLLAGAGFQSRYVGSLFCALPFIFIALLRLSNAKGLNPYSHGLIPTLILLFIYAHIATLFWTFIRYSVGFPLEGINPWIFRWAPDYWYLSLIAIIIFVASGLVLRSKIKLIIEN